MSRWIRPGQDTEWSELFTTFTTSAFRLEAQQTYSSDVEDAAVRRFLDGMPHGIDLSWTISKLESHRLTGQRQTLVRVVVEPPTDYTGMELSVYPAFATAGQETLIIPVPEGVWPEDVPRYDYWLFDEQDVWRMHYNDDHTWAGAELLDHDSAVADHLKWRDAAVASALSLDDYLAARTSQP